MYRDSSSEEILEERVLQVNIAKVSLKRNDINVNKRNVILPVQVL